LPPAARSGPTPAPRAPGASGGSGQGPAPAAGESSQSPQAPRLPLEAVVPSALTLPYAGIAQRFLSNAGLTPLRAADAIVDPLILREGTGLEMCQQLKGLGVPATLEPQQPVSELPRVQALRGDRPGQAVSLRLSADVVDFELE